VFKFVSVSFPDSPEGPRSVYKAVLMQKTYEHELLVLTFKDWDPKYESIRPGTPIEVKLSSNTTPRDFFGYIHHITPSATPGKMFTEVVCIGGSFPLKQASQQTYRDCTADQVIKEICIKHSLRFIGKPHPRVYEMISQAGYTDWQLAVRLAKQIGYTLRGENTDIYFEPILSDYELYKDAAKVFIMKDASDSTGSTLYAFQPSIGESIEYDGEMKSAVAISGVDRFSKAAMAQTKQKRNKTTKTKRQDEFFDRFNSLVVAPNPQIATYEAEAAEARNSFPYRGTASVLGDPTLRPNMPVYLAGIGATYSGYWTILSTEHVMIETERNVPTYVTNIVVGTDSLGSVNGVAGLEIAVPGSPKRKIKPGVASGKPKTSKPLIKSSARKNSNQNKGSFGKIGNRQKVTAKTKQPSTWVADKKTTRVTFTPKKIKSPTVANRVRSNAVR
jgi:phage protein D